MEPFIGEIIMFGGNFAPRNWALCDGQLLQISQNSALFSILGTTYGGDGRQTFALPDMRGRVSIHPGTGPGLSTYRLGQKGGLENVVLNTLQIPSHSHTFLPRCSTDDGTADSPVNNVPATHEAMAESPYAPSDNANMRGGNTGNTGGSQGHTNIQPYLCVNYIIALQGLFPSRN